MNFQYALDDAVKSPLDDDESSPVNANDYTPVSEENLDFCHQNALDRKASTGEECDQFLLHESVKANVCESYQLYNL